MNEPVISAALERRLIIQMAEEVHTWERNRGTGIIARGRNGISVYRDGGEATNDYGMTHSNWQRWVRKPSETVQDFANITRSEAYDLFDTRFRQHLGIDDLPLAIQGQMMNFAIHRAGAPVAVLNNLLVEKGYLPRSAFINVNNDRVMNTGVTVGRYPGIAEAAERYYEDVGAITFNNEYAEARADWYRDRGGRYVRPFVNRALKFRMDVDIEEARSQGFKIENNDRGRPIALLPDVVRGPNGAESVRMPDGSFMAYDQWYGEYILAHATGNGERSRAMRGSERPATTRRATPGREEDDVVPPPIPHVGRFMPLAALDAERFVELAEQEEGSREGNAAHRAIVGNRDVVWAIQNKLGFTGNDLDGRWGPKTQRAWEAYEAQHGEMMRDGKIVATEVAAILTPHKAAPNATDIHREIVGNEDMVKAIQARIGLRGRDVDGQWGPKTQAAFDAYELRTVGHNADGRISREELAQIAPPSTPQVVPQSAPESTPQPARDNPLSRGAWAGITGGNR